MHRNWFVTDNISLRALRPSDSAALFRLVQRNRNHLRAWLPWLDHVQSEADSREFLRQQWLARERNEALGLAILEHRSIVGTIAFHAFDRVNHATSLGYWLGQDACGRGIMRNCVKKCLEIAFNEERMNRVVIRCATGNKTSRAIPEALGFRHEGTQRQAEWLYDRFVDLEMYALLRAEWRLSLEEDRRLSDSNR